MRFSPLGRTGLTVSVLSIGSYHTYDRMDHADVVELLRRATAAGVNWFDVGHYTSAAHPELPESDTDRRFAAAREEAGIRREDYVHTEKVWYGGPRPPFKDQLSISLDRAGVDHADCVIYNPDTAYHFGTAVDMAQIVREMSELVEAGVTRSWGINHALVPEIDLACAYAQAESLHAPQVLQAPYSAIARRMVEDRAFEEVVDRWGLAVQATNALAVGVLAGRPAAQSSRPVGDAAMTAHAERVSADLAERAGSVGATAAQLALAFVLANARVTSVLFGASRLAQLEDDLGALEVLERVGADDLRLLLADLPQNALELQVGQLIPAR